MSPVIIIIIIVLLILILFIFKKDCKVHENFHRRGWRGRGMWRGGYPWFGKRTFGFPYWWKKSIYYLPNIEVKNDCDDNCMVDYKNCIDKGKTKEECADFLSICMKKCEN